MKRFQNKDGSVREYLYIVKGVRVDGKPRQKVVAYLGRLDELKKEGAIDSLVEGLCRYVERAQVVEVAEDLFCRSVNWRVRVGVGVQAAVGGGWPWGAAFPVCEGAGLGVRCVSSHLRHGA